MICLITGSSGSANLVDIRISSGDTLWNGEITSLDIRIENDMEMGAFSHGFQFWSDDGDTWSWDVDDYSEEGCYMICEDFTWSHWDCRSLVLDSRMGGWPFDMTGRMMTTQQNIDGIGRDTIMSGGVAKLNHMDPGPLEHMYSHYFRPGREELSRLCIDSCFVPPSGAFVFLDLYGVALWPAVLWEPGGQCWPVKASYVCGDVNGDGQFNAGRLISATPFIGWPIFSSKVQIQFVREVKDVWNG